MASVRRSSHQGRRRLLEAEQQGPLCQAQVFAAGSPAEDALRSQRGAGFGPQAHVVVVRLQPLVAVRAERGGAGRRAGLCGAGWFWGSTTAEDSYEHQYNIDTIASIRYLRLL